MSTAVQHERGPRNSTIRRQMALYLKEANEISASMAAHAAVVSHPFRPPYLHNGLLIPHPLHPHAHHPHVPLPPPHMPPTSSATLPEPAVISPIASPVTPSSSSSSESSASPRTSAPPPHVPPPAPPVPTGAVIQPKPKVSARRKCNYP